MWGCTANDRLVLDMEAVFPTHVGVYHAIAQTSASDLSFSPRMWGCTVEILAIAWGFLVFPTHVGVYRVKNLAEALSRGFPHACGGVPGQVVNWDAKVTFSPRMWGCT